MHTDAGLTRREVLHAGAAVGAAAGMPAPGPKVDI
jgi:TAT (twin-arginine translocation) pathway signal sequence